MQVSRLLTYPIKSLRAVELDSSELTQLGFPYDRRFMLLEVTRDEGDVVKYTNIHIAYYHKAALFHPSLIMPGHDPITEPGKIIVSFRPPQDESREITIPLTPETTDLNVIEVVMHKSVTRAYVMEQKYNDFFSSCFGVQVVLAYLGEHLRPVRMSHETRDPASVGRWREHDEKPQKGWLESLSSITSAASSYVMGAGEGDPKTEPRITFADCAPYLIASERSMDDLHRRLPEGELMDITKFRPNIIVSGAEEPWEEDFWTELTVGETTQIACVQNCGRCQSVNVDYATGALGANEAGKMLKMMQKDRRVDPGMKYSPIFGRYAFIGPQARGDLISVGDTVKVSKRSEERTVFGKLSLSPGRIVVNLELVLMLIFLVFRLGWPLHPMKFALPVRSMCDLRAR
jgi:uncharacterized protein YcbX